MAYRAQRYAPLGLVLGVVVFLSGATAYGGEPASKSGGDVAEFYADHRAGILAGSYLIGLAMFFLLVGIWGLRPAMPGVEAGEWATIFSAGVAFVAVELGVAAAAMTLAFISDDGPVDAGVAEALDNLSTIFSYVDWFPTAFFALLVSRAILGGWTLLPRWLGWVALVLVPVGLVAAYRPLNADIPVALLFFAFLVALGIVAFLRNRDLSVTQTPTGPS